MRNSNNAETIRISRLNENQRRTWMRANPLNYSSAPAYQATAEGKTGYGSNPHEALKDLGRQGVSVSRNNVTAR